MLTHTFTRLALAGSLALGAASLAQAQDSAALINLLTRKGIINDQEAEDLRAELSREFSSGTSAGKLTLGSHLTEFKLGGDVRLRHQSETQAPMLATGGSAVSNERTRHRFRFRFNGDALMQKGWGAGFALETASAADSGNQTFENGNADYNLYLARAYVSYQRGDFFFAGGKIKNPLYTTDLLWDSDINPQGVSESWKKSFGKNTLELRALQSIMDDRPESTFGPAGRDAWMFAQQAVYTHWLGANQAQSLVLAPGFLTYNQSVLDGMENELAFNGSTNGLALITFAGEYNLPALPSGDTLKFYWDSSYNLEAERRVRQVYGIPTSFDDDAFAWLVGFGYSHGSGKLQGDYSIKLDYRQVGIGSIDPNINDSDFAFSRLNQEGFKLGLSYNVTDFASLNGTYFWTEAMQDALVHPVANLDHSQTLQVDLVVKF